MNMKGNREGDKDDYRVSGTSERLHCIAMNKMTQKRDLYKFENCKVVLKTRAVDKVTWEGSIDLITEVH